MATSAKAQEPSMEEILASIRRIIADDGGAAPKAAAEPEPEADSAPAEESAAMGQDDIDALLSGMDGGGDEAVEEEVLDLTEEVDEEPEFQEVDAVQDVVFAEPEPEPEPEPVPAPRPVAAPAPKIALEKLPPVGREPLEELLSNQAGAMVGSAFNSLAHTVLVQNARTLDDLVKEMLKPMLKQWLDDNLPQIVDRLVRGEIERVSRGR